MINICFSYYTFQSTTLDDNELRLQKCDYHHTVERELIVHSVVYSSIRQVHNKKLLLSEIMNSFNLI